MFRVRFVIFLKDVYTKIGLPVLFWFNLLNSDHKRTLSKLKIGNHDLKIETGRHTTPKTPTHLRICTFCTENTIEDELHFILSCTHYTTERNKLYHQLDNKYNHQFSNFDNSNKIKFLFNSVDPFVCNLFANFIFHATLKRKNHK